MWRCSWLRFVCSQDSCFVIFCAIYKNILLLQEESLAYNILMVIFSAGFQWDARTSKRGFRQCGFHKMESVFSMDYILPDFWECKAADRSHPCKSVVIF